MKPKNVYICEACGAHFYQWHGQCPACKEWGVLRKDSLSIKLEKEKKKKEVSCVPLQSISFKKEKFISSGSKIVDSFLGNGFVPSSVLLLGGEPGIGKSTFLLQLMSSFCKSGRKGVYISGEESLDQVKQRAERLNIDSSNLYISNAHTLNDVLYICDSFESDSLLAIDSVQTIIDEDIEGFAGSISQVRSVSSKIIEKSKGKGFITVLVSHVTKDGQIAGPKLMEHMVDVVLYLEGDKQYQFRILKSFKNRFGSSDRILVLNMTEKGLKIVNDPSTFFLKARDIEASGTALVMTVEGQWAFVVEVQALVTKSPMSFPRRTSLGFDLNRLHLLLAVLEKRLNVYFGDKDVYVKIGAGLKLNDPGIDLGIVAAILSSYFDKPIMEKAVFWGEVDLNGQIRSVFREDLRLFYSNQLKYNPVIFPKGGVGKNREKNFVPIFNIKELLELLTRM